MGIFKFTKRGAIPPKTKALLDYLQAGNESLKETNAIAFVSLAENGILDDVTASEHSDVFLDWEAGITFVPGNIRRRGEELYKCLQGHTSLKGWEPERTPALWRKIGDPAEEFPAWSQPIGAGDAYMTGDKVSYANKHWESTVDTNVWAPGVYGWQEV